MYISNCRVYIINKMRAKTEIHLGISGEKIEIDPVITGKGAARFWNRQRAVSYHIDNIAWCEVTETKGSKTIFTLVYTPQSSASDNILSQLFPFYIITHCLMILFLSEKRKILKKIIFREFLILNKFHNKN